MQKTQVALRLLILILTLYGLSTLWSVGSEVAKAGELLELERATANTLREENAQLRLQLEKTDEEDNWEHIARQQLGLVSPEEIVIYNVGD